MYRQPSNKHQSQKSIVGPEIPERKYERDLIQDYYVKNGVDTAAFVFRQSSLYFTFSYIHSIRESYMMVTNSCRLILGNTFRGVPSLQSYFFQRCLSSVVLYILNNFIDFFIAFFFDNLKFIFICLTLKLQIDIFSQLGIMILMKFF